MAVSDKWIITQAQVDDLKRFATDLVDGCTEEEQASIGHNIEAIVATCESQPADEDDEEDEEIEQEDEE